MKQAQPALLYLVPTTLGSVTVTALIRREFGLFFTGKGTPKSKPPQPKNEDEECIIENSMVETDLAVKEESLEANSDLAVKEESFEANTDLIVREDSLKANTDLAVKESLEANKDMES